MARRSCFVIMAIGDQQFADVSISAADLRHRYDDLIKEALLKADPELDIIRADDVAAPGTITSDILTRIMHSDIVVADVSFPNPNVFYELGLRHACRTGTAIIKDSEAPRVPFDIAHLRHIEYTNSPSGLKKLAQDFRTFFDLASKSPDRPDSQFQELASLTKYDFPDYSDPEDQADPETEAIMALMENPAVLDLMVKKSSGADVDPSQIMSAALENPDFAGLMAKAMINSGDLSLTNARSKRPPAIGGTRKPKKNKRKDKKKRRR